MREKKEAQRYLEQVGMLDAVVHNKLLEREQWRETALHITAGMGGDRVMRSGSRSKMADAVDRCVDMEAEIDRAVERLARTKQAVVHTLEGLDNPTEYNLLHMRYIRHMTLQEIADHYGREYSWTTTTHSRALSHVQELLDRAQVCDRL